MSIGYDQGKLPAAFPVQTVTMIKRASPKTRMRPVNIVRRDTNRPMPSQSQAIADVRHPVAIQPAPKETPADGRTIGGL